MTRRARPDATLVTVNVFVIDVPGLDQRLHEHFGHVQRDNLKKNANLRAEMDGNLRQPISRKSGKNGRIFFKQTAHSNRRPWTTVRIWTKFFRRTIVQVRRFERFALIQAASPLIGQRVISHHISSSFTLRFTFKMKTTSRPLNDISMKPERSRKMGPFIPPSSNKTENTVQRCAFQTKRDITRLSNNSISFIIDRLLHLPCNQSLT